MMYINTPKTFKDAKNYCKKIGEIFLNLFTQKVMVKEDVEEEPTVIRMKELKKQTELMHSNIIKP